MKRIFHGTVAMSILLTGCLSTPQSISENESHWSDTSFEERISFNDDPSLPDWILTPPSDRDFIYGIGLGTTEQLAKQRALINAARQFSGHVKSVLADNFSKEQGDAGSKIIDEVKDQVIYGSRFLDSYQDKEGSKWILVRAPVDCILDAAEWVIINHSLESNNSSANDYDFKMSELIDSLMDTLDDRVDQKGDFYYHPIPSEPDDFIRIEPGRFLMGQPEEEDSIEEEDQHSVEISRPFLMARYEVTQELWEEITGLSLEEQSILSDYPGIYGQSETTAMYHISWQDAVAFCNELSIRRGLAPVYSMEENRYVCDFEADGYRLPTEAEWEYASRGGHLAGEYAIYSGHNNPNDAGWYWLNSGDVLLEELYPGYYSNTALLENNSRVHKVGQKKPNALGIFDMSGNVSEWCWDWYGESYYDQSPEIDPSGPSSGDERIHRGGNWSFTYRICRSAQRSSSPPELRDDFMGIRLVRSAKWR